MADQPSNKEIMDLIRGEVISSLHDFYGEFSEFKREMLEFKQETTVRLGNIEKELQQINERLTIIEQRLGNFDFEEYQQFKKEIVDLKVRVARLEEQQH